MRVIAFGLLLAGCWSAPGGGDLAARLPVTPGQSVVVVSFDALRPDALGVYGYSRPTSPTIDAFAATSVVFERAYTAAPVTPTSFAAAFSACLPHRVFRQWHLDAPALLAEVFAAAGYQTAAFSSNVQLDPTRGFARGFSHYDVQEATPDEALVERMAAWIAAHREAPFLTWIHLLTPHAPYRRRDDAARFYAPGYTGPFLETSGTRFEAHGPEDLKRLRDLYDGEVWHADQLFRQLLDGLRNAVVLDHTIVVLTADHGEEFGEHGGVQHGRLHEEHLRIPLVIHHPQHSRGSRPALLTSNVDFGPSLAAMVGLPWPNGCDGQSIFTADRPRDRVISIAMTGSTYRGAALLHGAHRLIATCLPKRKVELFDLHATLRALTDLVPRILARP
jgi:arylsulfatase A-like enzyme